MAVLARDPKFPKQRATQYTTESSDASSRETRSATVVSSSFFESALRVSSASCSAAFVLTAGLLPNRTLVMVCVIYSVNRCSDWARCAADTAEASMIHADAISARLIGRGSCTHQF